MPAQLMRPGISRFFGIFWVIAALLSVRCTSSSFSTTSPTADKCQLNITSAPSSFGPNGGSGLVAIATERECRWTVTPESPWVSVAGQSDGQGEAQVPYSVAPNPAPFARTGSIKVGSEHVQLSQAAAPCTFNLNRTSAHVESTPGTVSVELSTLTGCGWTAVSRAPWIAIVSGQSGNASTTVTFSIQANTGAERVGDATIAGQTFTITQEATVIPPSPPPSGPGPVPAPPAPGPPAPTPIPPPIQAEEVTIDGRVRDLSGSCPSVQFRLGDRGIDASSSTGYRDGRCTDLKHNEKVRVRGLTQANGRVAATLIEFR
jgi:hypothetical protein